MLALALALALVLVLMLTASACTCLDGSRAHGVTWWWWEACKDKRTHLVLRNSLNSHAI